MSTHRRPLHPVGEQLLSWWSYGPDGELLCAPIPARCAQSDCARVRRQRVETVGACVRSPTRAAGGCTWSSSRGRLLLTQLPEAAGFRRINYFPDRPRRAGALQRHLARGPGPLIPCLPAAIRPAPAPCRTAVTSPAGRIRIPSPATFAPAAGRLQHVADRYITAEGAESRCASTPKRPATPTGRLRVDALGAPCADEQRTAAATISTSSAVVATRDFNMGAMEQGPQHLQRQKLVADPGALHRRGLPPRRGHRRARISITDRQPRDLPRLVPALAQRGFTVFREQQFCADMGSPALKRIEDDAAAAARSSRRRRSAGACGAPRAVQRHR